MLTILDHTLQLDRPTFESIIKVALDKTISVCKRVLRDAKLELSDIQNVVLVGDLLALMQSSVLLQKYSIRNRFVLLIRMKLWQLVQLLLQNQLIGNTQKVHYY